MPVSISRPRIPSNQRTSKFSLARKTKPIANMNGASDDFEMRLRQWQCRCPARKGPPASFRTGAVCGPPEGVLLRLLLMRADKGNGIENRSQKCHLARKKEPSVNATG